MPCFHPLKAYRSKNLNASGKRGIVFQSSKGLIDMPVTLPCGQCIGCRLERSRQWAIRCYHEASLYSDNCFITLTYNDAHLPSDLSLDLAHFQKFMKRLRKKFGSNIRFFHCGEYGENFGRPHYHACLFNFDFSDKKIWMRTGKNNSTILYRSETLEKLWPYGYSSIGDVTFQSAAYVARYIMKKVTGEAADEHYNFVMPDTGEVFYRRPEYTTMSRRPGIGKLWFDKYSDDVFPSDYIIINGKKVKPPKYYDTCYEFSNPIDFKSIKINRNKAVSVHLDNNTPDRLLIREEIQSLKLTQLKRTLK
ncbi:replication initiator protein [Microviridae sp.]|nr:replication initiator protein [Microviridae sp.]